MPAFHTTLAGRPARSVSLTTALRILDISVGTVMAKVVEINIS